jgi:hypothetical protein
MNTVLTIDIGLRNLALCAMESPKRNAAPETCRILFWKVINTLESDSENHVCASLNKNGTVCGKKCCLKYTLSHSLPVPEVFYTCKRHFPKGQPITTANKIIVKQVKDYQLQDIAEKVLAAVQQVYSELHFRGALTKVLIELQPKINNKMKLVSHIVFAKLIDLTRQEGLRVPIRFVRAAKKLKAYKGPEVACALKGSYARRKFLSIKYTEYMLLNQWNNANKDEWLPFFNTHTKKDDLSDTFLFCISELL